MQPYTKDIEQIMKKYYDSLTESSKRRYAAIEAIKLNHGGQKYICNILGCDEETLKKGTEELTSDRELLVDRIRLPGGGRAKIIDTIENIDEIFLDILKDGTAGSPTEEIKWTNLNKRQISEAFKQKGHTISEEIVAQLLKKHNYAQRKAYKNETYKNVENRDSQFVNISSLKETFLSSDNNPVISVDVKKRNK